MNESSASIGSPMVRMTGISKRFGAVRALEGVDFEIRPGEVHVLAGENGAGKSTLIKVLAGVYGHYDGTIEINGHAVRPRSPTEAASLGIAVIHQELSLVGSMTVSDNVYLGRPKLRPGGFVSGRAQRTEAEGLLRQLGIDIPADRPVESLPIGSQQLIEIAKALGRRARVLIMDEPTSALNAPEVEKLFAMIGGLKARGYGIVYITHKMEEIDRIADRITVLRDGRFVGSAPASELTTDKLIQWIIGRDMDRHFPRHKLQAGPERLRIEDFCVHPPGRFGRLRRRRIEGVTLSVRAGEILGIGGLQGSGASELLMGLFGGFGRRASGKVFLNGRPVRFASPRHAIDSGVALLTNDRKATGLVLSMSVVANTVLPSLRNLSRSGWRRFAAERAATDEMARTLGLRAASWETEVGSLSGGNQQKVALAKWLRTDPQLLLLDEPTRGIDVGAKREIYDLMNRWTARQIAIILISSEMPELLAVSDRIAVMHRGRLTAELTRSEASAETVLAAAMGKRM